MAGTLVLFWAFAGLALASALGCITRRSPVASALWLVVTLFALAALFVLLDAQFIAVLQLLVYAGAIMVLFLFVIMLLNLGHPGPMDVRGPVGVGTAFLLGGVLLFQLWILRQAAPPASIQLPPGSVARLQQEQGLVRSEEHTSELQSRGHLVCRLLLEKKKRKTVKPRPLDRFLRRAD